MLFAEHPISEELNDSINGKVAKLELENEALHREMKEAQQKLSEAQMEVGRLKVMNGQSLAFVFCAKCKNLFHSGSNLITWGRLTEKKVEECVWISVAKRASYSENSAGGFVSVDSWWFPRSVSCPFSSPGELPCWVCSKTVRVKKKWSRIVLLVL